MGIKFQPGRYTSWQLWAAVDGDDIVHVGSEQELLRRRDGLPVVRVLVQLDAAAGEWWGWLDSGPKLPEHMACGEALFEAGLPGGSLAYASEHPGGRPVRFRVTVEAAVPAGAS